MMRHRNDIQKTLTYHQDMADEALNRAATTSDPAIEGYHVGRAQAHAMLAQAAATELQAVIMAEDLA